MLDAIYAPINNGVYRSGFATTQSAYDEAVVELFDALASGDVRFDGDPRARVRPMGAVIEALESLARHGFRGTRAGARLGALKTPVRFAIEPSSKSERS